MTRKLRQNMKICISFNYYFKINFKEYMFSSSRAYSTPARSKKFVSTYQDTSIPKERKQSMNTFPQIWARNADSIIRIMSFITIGLIARSLGLPSTDTTNWAKAISKSEDKLYDDSQIEQRETNFGFHFFTIVRQKLHVFGLKYLLTKH